MKQAQELGALFLFLIVLALVGALSACGSVPQLQAVNVPVQVECKEVEPSRPSMPTDAITEADSLDRKMAAVIAEIDIREGFEGKLIAALRGCTKPIEAKRGK